MCVPVYADINDKAQLARQKQLLRARLGLDLPLGGGGTGGGTGREGAYTPGAPSPSLSSAGDELFGEEDLLSHSEMSSHGTRAQV